MPHRLETDRLILRPFTLDDADDAWTVLEGHPDVYRHDPGFKRTREQRAKIIQKYAESNDEDGVGTLAITLKSTGALMGYVGLQLYILPGQPLATPEVELYYKLGRPFWGQGYGIEACRALLRFAFDEMRLARIVTITAVDNTESIRLLERLGMRIDPAPPVWAGFVTATLDNPHANPLGSGEAMTSAPPDA